MKYYPTTWRRVSAGGPTTSLLNLMSSRYTAARTIAKFWRRYAHGYGNLRGSRTPSRAHSLIHRPMRTRPINQNTQYKYSKTIVVQFTVYNGTTGTQGFALPGTTSNTNNYGLFWTFTPTGVTVVNSNSGSVSLNVAEKTALSSLYEQCRLDKVRIRIYWNQNTVNGTAGTSFSGVQQMPIIQSAIDHDLGATLPTSVNALASYPNLKIFQLGTSAIGKNTGASFDMSFVPRVPSYGASANELFLPISTFLSVDNGGPDQNYGGLLQFIDLQTLMTDPSGNAIMGIYSAYITLDTTWKGQK